MDFEKFPQGFKKVATSFNLFQNISEDLAMKS